MNDHQRLTRIWKLELSCRRTLAEKSGWVDLIERRSNTIRQCKLDINEHQLSIEFLSGQITEWDVEINKVERRIQMVKDGIQSGLMQDIQQAQIQIEEFTLQMNGIEEQSLDAMEEQEVLHQKQLIARDTVAATQQMLLHETNKYEHIRPRIEQQLEEINEESELLLNQMNPAVSRLYRLILPAKPKAVAGVVNNACGACFMSLPTELLWTATQRETICHCPMCGVFLLPEEPQIPD